MVPETIRLQDLFYYAQINAFHAKFVRAYKMLAEAFQKGQLTTDPSFDELLRQASEDVVEAYQMALAIMKLARNQVVLEVRLDEHGRLLEDYGHRLETIEVEYTPGRPVHHRKPGYPN